MSDKEENKIAQSLSMEERDDQIRKEERQRVIEEVREIVDGMEDKQNEEFGEETISRYDLLNKLKET